ncbi:MAG: insulinase family protein, partial [Fimbriimonadaceae bacterium]|nr:insulinase family protein [Alphaproteobacteria bacterium]
MMSKYVLTGFIALFLVWTGPAFAAKIERVISPGGIEAWLVEDHTLPMISLRLAFPGGSSQDPVGKEGLSGMVSSLIDEGAADLDSQAFQGRLQELAIQLSFSSSRDHIEGQVKTLTENADTAFHLLHTALTEPRFDEEPVERLRAQILTGLR